MIHALLAIRPTYDLAPLAGRLPAADRAPDAKRAEALADILAIQGDTANILIAGPIIPGIPTCLGTDTHLLHHAIRQAIDDPAVAAIRLIIDSPGGIVAHLPPIVATLRDSPKPIAAAILSECSSAAYWIAAQAKAGIHAQRGAIIGCLGAYATLEDSTAAAQAAGVTVHLYPSDPLKGIGTPGTPVTEDHDALMRKHVAEVADLFWRDIHAARPQIPRAAYTGAFHLPPVAKRLALIDDYDL